MKPRAIAISLGATALAALAAVFTAYLSPHLVLELANQVWGCF